MSDHKKPLTDDERIELNRLRSKPFDDTSSSEWLRFKELYERKDVPQETINEQAKSGS